MTPTTKSSNNINIISRYRFLRILRAAIECEEYQFGKQASMLWLANYPGDLYTQYFQARTLEKLGKTKDAMTIYGSLIDSDPFFAEPYQSLINLTEDVNQVSLYRSIFEYLTQATMPEGKHPEWLSALWKARLSFASGNYEEALLHIHTSLINNPPTPIPAVLHLKTIYKQDNLAMLGNLCEIYYEKWPKSLDVNIVKAISEINDGNEATAVERLHWVASHDSAGQVITRLMGNHHRFANLWTENLEIYFDLPIPASVSGQLGLNQLQTGLKEEPDFKTAPEELAPHAAGPQDITQPIHVSNILQTIDKSFDAPEKLTEDVQDLGTSDNELEVLEEEEVDVESIQKTFSKLAKRLKKPDLERADNRFPIYIIMTSRKQLEGLYGPNTSDVIDAELKKLTNLLQKLPNWGAMLFYPDDPAQMAQLGMNPRIISDAWQAKLALADLDDSLAKRGEMIGALLIIGGPEIIPFHHLPNPTLDNDLDVPSDNPYATIDDNYFIPQWPVGRLPGESGPDAGLLLYQIRHLTYKYQSQTKSSKSGSVNLISIINAIWRFFTNLGAQFQVADNLGYSAEIWQEASEEVFKTIGKPGGLKLSPPINSENLLPNNQPQHDLGYFNLHGIKDGPNWYGQKDFASQEVGPDYPIALSPEMFSENNKSPDFVLSEACYGANILNKHHEEALSLKFLDSGTNAFVGSTCIAYGSVTTPLVAADFVAERYWQEIVDGQPAGYALMQAKLDLAADMTRLQGFLDGEDQKSILSFVLYGDPLAKYDGLKGVPKPLMRFKSHPKVKTISDSDLEPAIKDDQLPNNVSRQVKKAVEKYLPGLEGAQMKVNKSVSYDRSKSNKTTKSERYVVTFEKSVDYNAFIDHHHFARMTFDDKGKLIKFTTSR